jgi:hypothetical protein
MLGRPGRSARGRAPTCAGSARRQATGGHGLKPSRNGGTCSLRPWWQAGKPLARFPTAHTPLEWTKLDLPRRSSMAAIVGSPARPRVSTRRSGCCPKASQKMMSLILCRATICAAAISTRGRRLRYTWNFTACGSKRRRKSRCALAGIVNCRRSWRRHHYRSQGGGGAEGVAPAVRANQGRYGHGK